MISLLVQEILKGNKWNNLVFRINEEIKQEKKRKNTNNEEEENSEEGNVWRWSS